MHVYACVKAYLAYLLIIRHYQMPSNLGYSYSHIVSQIVDWVSSSPTTAGSPGWRSPVRWWYLRTPASRHGCGKSDPTMNWNVWRWWTAPHFVEFRKQRWWMQILDRHHRHPCCHHQQPRLSHRGPVPSTNVLSNWTATGVIGVSAVSPGTVKRNAGGAQELCRLR